MMRRSGTILAAVVLATTAMAIAAEPKLADKPYARNGCSIHFPHGWREAVPGATAFVFATAPTADVRDGQEQAANFNINRVALAKADLMALAREYQTQKPKDVYTPVEPPREVTINGLKGVVFGGTYTMSGKNLRNRQWLIAAPGRVYIVTLTALSGAWATHEAVGEASVATFRATDEKK